MKKIVPFHNVLDFNTSVSKITAISLEHEVKKERDTISGEFFITGEYKVTDAILETNKFNFELPFDIALGCNYKLDTLSIDIDDFKYELIDNNKLKVDITMALDGEEEPVREETKTEEEPVSIDPIVYERPVIDKIDPSIDIDIDNDTSVTIDNKELKTDDETLMEDTSKPKSIFSNLEEEDKYVTYRVYRILEDDTLDKILEKYHISKEELGKYNNLDDLKTGMKLIIPANE